MAIIQNIAKSLLAGTEFMKQVASDVLSKKFVYQASASESVKPAKKDVDVVNIRGVDIDRRTYDEEVRPIIFGEISNRAKDKKQLEASVILNTALNRVLEAKEKGVNKDFRTVLTEKNQYQAYGGKQYQAYKNNQLDELGLSKKQEVDSLLDETWNSLVSGKFEDVTKGAKYYKHNEQTGEIFYDDTRSYIK